MDDVKCSNYRQLNNCSFTSSCHHGAQQRQQAETYRVVEKRICFIIAI